MSTKIAIIGAGGMAAYHAKGFREAGAEIVALADLNAAAAEKAAAITPVPGGVGPMTIACLLANTLKAAENSPA